MIFELHYCFCLEILFSLYLCYWYHDVQSSGRESYLTARVVSALVKQLKFSPAVLYKFESHKQMSRALC
jgi:hypothetical protein